MGKKRSRKRYEAAFKGRVALAAARGDKTLSELTSQFGVHGSRALHSPVNTLLANGAYMLMASLAWNLKAWLELTLPQSEVKRTGHSGTHALRTPERQASSARKPSSDRERLLGLEFRTFVNYIVRVPAQVVKSGRQLIVRLLVWNDWQPVFMRLAERLLTALTAPRSERQRC